MYSNRYPAAVCAKGGIVPAADPLKLFLPRIRQFHSGAVLREEENGLLLVPFLLSVATFVRWLWHHYLRVLL